MRTAPGTDTGFTLIELLVVIAIVLILVVITLPNFLSAQIRAMVAAVELDLRTTIFALESYFQDWKEYPKDHHANWPHSRPSENGLTMLTTPIRYLPEMPTERFGPQEVGMPASQVISTRSTYFGGSGSDNHGCMPGLETSHPGRPGRLRPPPDCVHAYLIYSIGPDRAANVLGRTAFPSGDKRFAYPVTIRKFAPTNGTRSNGDIFQMAGDWRSGSIEVDSQMITQPR